MEFKYGKIRYCVTSHINCTRKDTHSLKENAILYVSQPKSLRTVNFFPLFLSFHNLCKIVILLIFFFYYLFCFFLLLIRIISILFIYFKNVVFELKPVSTCCGFKSQILLKKLRSISQFASKISFHDRHRPQITDDVIIF